MPSRTAQGCPNSGQEQNDCVTSHLGLPLPRESFLPCSLTDPSRVLQKSDPAATTNRTTVGTTGNEVVPKLKAVVALSGGIWQLLI